jgi:tRNA (guanine-N7-)-methyltransferase
MPLRCIVDHRLVFCALVSVCSMKNALTAAFIIIMAGVQSPRFCLSFTASLHRKTRWRFLHSQRNLHLPLHLQEPQETIYTIDCPPTDPETLRSIVQKHSSQLDRWLDNKPIAAHTRRAFDMLGLTPNNATKIILDSGCGTGRSSVLLADMHPDHLVIGVDRSLVRLNRNVMYRKNSVQQGDARDEEEPLVQSMPDKPNLRLVRAELSDFWRCCLESNITISRHYLLYPNPYPKKARVKSRWYAHPSFPLIFQLGGDAIVVKSNWNLYLQEFSQSVGYMMQCGAVRPYLVSAERGPTERIDKSVAWTNFEKKYDDTGEKTYELVLERR